MANEVQLRVNDTMRTVTAAPASAGPAESARTIPAIEPGAAGRAPDGGSCARRR